jgi:hypothetical protein
MIMGASQSVEVDTPVVDVVDVSVPESKTEQPQEEEVEQEMDWFWPFL